MHCNSKALHLYFKRRPIRYHVGVRPVRLSDGEGGGLFFLEIFSSDLDELVERTEKRVGGCVPLSPPRGGVTGFF